MRIHLLKNLTHGEMYQTKPSLAEAWMRTRYCENLVGNDYSR